ncbi:hypothetical protein CROQUDRAFT_97432 [Cronartium quercuum f. sp. fusiforme G11]|uniref:Uncharacterized protein n=1 Tax=Cronartium quercuum f. sp. fusiforme G11 TaxID=708437 RepID=A0A9P6T822_9BASI|nr:hypothetical protein CROQUDRAFT_97432 [Cronartium quercuum f. sp. fusiforme G11]
MKPSAPEICSHWCRSRAPSGPGPGATTRDTFRPETHVIQEPRITPVIMIPADIRGIRIHGRRALPDEKRDFSLAGVNRAITAVRFESGWRRSHHRLPFAAASPVYAPPCAGEIACPLNRVMRFPAATWQLHSA